MKWYIHPLLSDFRKLKYRITAATVKVIVNLLKIIWKELNYPIYARCITEEGLIKHVLIFYLKLINYLIANIL